MKRKLIYAFLVSLTFGVVGLTSVDAETPTREWCFKFENGMITNYKNYSVNCPVDVVIPSTIEGETVEKIGAGAFMYDGIESVVIPETVKSIGYLAFATNFIENITIPDTVIKIGYGAFNDNPANELIYERTDNNNDGVAEINNTKLISVAYDSAYYGDTKIINIPEYVKTIGTKAFYSLFIDVLNLPQGLTTIESKAFYGSVIGNVNIPESLESADLSVDIEQIPYLDVLSYRWVFINSDNKTEEYKFGTGQNIDELMSEIYLKPELRSAYGSSSAYNKINLKWDLGGSVDRVQIYKYNPSTKKYEYYSYSTNSKGVTLTKGINPGQTYYYKLRARVTTPDGKYHYSDYSDPIAVKPVLKTPTGVNATKYRSGVAKITWNKVAGADGYNLYKYSSKTKKYYYVKSVKGTYTTTSYGLKKGYSTYYKVRAYKIVNGKKVYSNYSYSDYVRV